VTLHRLGATESPAATAHALIFDRGNDAFLAPVHRLGEVFKAKVGRDWRCCTRLQLLRGAPARHPTVAIAELTCGAVGELVHGFFVQLARVPIVAERLLQRSLEYCLTLEVFFFGCILFAEIFHVLLKRVRRRNLRVVPAVHGVGCSQDQRSHEERQHGGNSKNGTKRAGAQSALPGSS